MIALILGGGAGTRLYPLTENRSKPAVPLAGKKKGFCIIHNGSQVHSVKTYKQALDYIKKYSKIKKKATSSLEQFL